MFDSGKMSEGIASKIAIYNEQSITVYLPVRQSSQLILHIQQFGHKFLYAL
jgi:hypothetical protein